MHNLRKVGKNAGPILSRLWTNVHEHFRDVEDPLQFPTHLPGCVCNISL